MEKKQIILEVCILLFAFLAFVGAENIAFSLFSFFVCAVLVFIYIKDEKKNGRW